MEKKKIDEVDINEPKVFTKKSTTKKAPAKKKIVKEEVVKEEPKNEIITEQYQYKGEGQLIMDKPSTPLTLIEPVKQPSNKEIFENLSREKQFFTLKYNGSLIYDSEGKPYSKIFNDLSFEEDGFILYNKKYSYDGLNFKFKR